MDIPTFLKRCDAYLTASGRSKAWLSRKLFFDGTRLTTLSEGTDVGVRRLQTAVNALAALETELLVSA